MSNSSTSLIWAKTVEIVKNRTTSQPLWETLERTISITIDDDLLVIGVDPTVPGGLSRLNSSETNNLIQQTVTHLAGRPLRIRFIEGADVNDWETVKTREARMSESRSAAFDKRDRAQIDTSSWDSLHETITRSYATLSNRQFSQTKAKYVVQSLATLLEAVQSLTKGEITESDDRQINRILFAIGQNAELQPTMVALEWEKLLTSKLDT